MLLVELVNPLCCRSTLPRSGCFAFRAWDFVHRSGAALNLIGLPTIEVNPRLLDPQTQILEMFQPQTLNPECPVQVGLIFLCKHGPRTANALARP